MRTAYSEGGTLRIKIEGNEYAEAEEDTRTWGKDIGIPPRIGFGGLKLACKDSIWKTKLYKKKKEMRLKELL